MSTMVFKLIFAWWKYWNTSSTITGPTTNTTSATCLRARTTWTTPPPVALPVIHHVQHSMHQWLPKTVYGKSFQDVACIENMLQIWSQLQTFHGVQFENVQTHEAIIPFCLEGFHIHYINAIPSALEDMDDYLNMWRAVLWMKYFTN